MHESLQQLPLTLLFSFPEFLPWFHSSTSTYFFRAFRMPPNTFMCNFAEQVSIGADEYDSELADDYNFFVNTMVIPIMHNLFPSSHNGVNSRATS